MPGASAKNWHCWMPSGGRESGFAGKGPTAPSESLNWRRMRWTAVGAWALALAVMIGAFGAHGLRGRLDDYSMNIYERAVFYHFVHALGILIVAALSAAGVVNRRAT